MGQLRDQVDVGDGLVQDDAVHRTHIGGDDLQDRPQGIGNVPCLSECDNNTQGAYLHIALLCYGIIGRRGAPSSLTGATAGRFAAEKGAMHELMRTNDPVTMSFAQSVLQGLGIESFVADQHMSIVEGSIGAFPRRLLVGADDLGVARRALTEAGLAQWLVGVGDAHA
jgi:hypothetical protein